MSDRGTTLARWRAGSGVLMQAPRAMGLAAAVGLAGSLALFWPGLAMFDTVAQYEQVLAGAYDDWHPPAMARLWSVLAPLGPGAAPMLVVQLALYWSGIGLLAAALGARRARAGAAVLVIGLWPPLLGWQAVVLKDSQMAGALLVAAGLVGWWRLRNRRVPVAAAVGAGLLIGYATLVRANAVFATVPLAVALLARGEVRHRAGLAIAGIVATLALAPLVNHGLLGASRSGVERTEAIYDLAGIAVRAGPGASGTGLTATETQAIAARGCSRPFFWDPLGEPSRCDATVERLRQVPVGTLYATLAGAALHHPLAYAAHRLAHLNSTERWLVPYRWPGAAPPLASEANPDGLATPGAARPWQRLAGLLVEWPTSWPVAWVVLAATGLALARRSPFAGALFVSALGQEASFAVLSIASDLRYHLWPMLATALGWAVLASAPPRFGAAARIGAGVLAAVVLAGLVARATLPLPPQTYAGMLGPPVAQPDAGQGVR